MVTAYSIFRKVRRSLHRSNFSRSLCPKLTQTFISRFFFYPYSFLMLRSRFVRPTTTINTVRTVVTTSPLSPGVTTFHSIWTKKVHVYIESERNKQIGLSGSGLAFVAGSFVFRLGKWAGEARNRMWQIFLMPLVCSRFARSFAAHLRERRDHQLHQLNVYLYQFYLNCYKLPRT